MTVSEELDAFYEAIAEDTRIGAYHITLYIALLRLRRGAGWQNPVRISRVEVMRLARMSRRSYNRYMNDMTIFGYIKYQPTCNPAFGSTIYFRKL